MQCEMSSLPWIDSTLLQFDIFELVIRSEHFSLTLYSSSSDSCQTDHVWLKLWRFAEDVISL